MAAGLDKNLKTEFIGYCSFADDVKVLYILSEGLQVENAQQGEEVTVILDRTPFYAEGGGQAADTGVIVSETGVVRVNDCRKTGEGIYLHMGVVCASVGLVRRLCMTTSGRFSCSAYLPAMEARPTSGLTMAQSANSGFCKYSTMTGLS